MEIKEIDSKQTLDMLASIFKSKTLIPFLGSGFTVGCKVKSGKMVPTGRQLQKIMIDSIINNNKFSDAEIDKIKAQKFSETSDLFFDEEICAKEISDKILEEYFYEAELAESKQSFINHIEWPYIYTLNIDDAIERASEFKVALPFDPKLHEKSKLYKTVFKVHGDINQEIRSSERRLVFKKSEYYKSLSDNKTMLDLICQDLNHKNVIFIGCSLDDEIDLEFINFTKNIHAIKSTKRIFFTSEDIGIVERKKYQNLGINCLIRYKKNDYESIYTILNKAFQESAVGDGHLDSFSKKFFQIGLDVDQNRDFLISGIVNLDEKNTSSINTLPYYYGDRDIEQELINKIKIPQIIILEGRRFSGKTLLSIRIALKFADRKVYFVDSKTDIEITAFNKIIGQSNSLIIFDSNSLDQEKVRILSRNSLEINKRSTTIVVVTNENELHLDEISPPRCNSVRYKLKNTFSAPELNVINQKAKEVKLPTFTQGNSILDKVVNAYFTIGENVIISKVAKSDELFKLAYYVAIMDKIYGQEISNLKIDYSEVIYIIDKTQPFLVAEDTNFDEIIDHTGFKVTTHSISWVTSLLREYFKKKGVTWCSEKILEMLKDLFNKNRRTAIELRKFDNLNFIFSRDADRSAGKLIYKIYDELENIEGREPDLFVQKAKAYYNMYRESDSNEKLLTILSELKIAETWAKTSHNTATQRNIEHIRALICLRMINDNFTEENHIINTVLVLSRLITEHHDNGHVRTLFTGDRFGRSFLDKFMDLLPKLNIPRLLEVKEDIELINRFMRL